MKSGGKKALIAILQIFLWIGRLIYRTGWGVERFFVFLFRHTLLPVLRFLRKCTPRNIYNAVCAVGEWTMRMAVCIYRGLIRFVVWAAHSVVEDFCYWAPAFCVIAVACLLVFFRHYTIALEVSVDGTPSRRSSAPPLPHMSPPHAPTSVRSPPNQPPTRHPVTPGCPIREKRTLRGTVQTTR